MTFHIGSRIKEVLERRGLSKVGLSRKLNMTATNVHKIFKRATIDTGLLAKLSVELEYDFFQHYRPAAAESVVKEQEVEYISNKDTNTSQCLKAIEHLTLKLEMAQKEIDYLKKINTLLEKNQDPTP
jgi:DNA-binding Xre family transcriptional regulator